MSPAYSRLEAAVFETLLPSLEAEGFQVFLQPSRKILPKFMSNYQPDAIAIKGDRKIAIEVMSAGGRPEAKLQRLRSIFEDHADWELRLVYAPPRTAEHPMSVPPRESIVENLDRVLTIFDESGPVPGLLNAWSVFEAAARYLIPSNFERPQTPGRLLEILASDGYITPDEADSLRRLGGMRNDAAHGQLEITLTREELAELVRVARTMIDLSGSSVPGPVSSQS